MPQRTNWLCLLLVAAFGVAPTAHAQDAVSPRFVLSGRDGPMPPARLVSLGEKWVIETSAGDDAIPGTGWAGLHQEGRGRPDPPAENFVLLGSGDRLQFDPTQSIRLHDGRVLFAPARPLRPQEGTELSLFAPFVAMIFRSAPEGVDDVELFLTRLRKELREHDVLLLHNGDSIEGKVIALDKKLGCEMLADGEKIQTPWHKLAGIAFATTGLARPRLKQTHALAVLAGGGRVHFASLNYYGAKKLWSGRTSAGADVTVAERGIIALDLLQGPAVFLSELTPLRYEQTPYLGIRWPVAADASVDGRPLRVGHDCYDKGIGVHGQCRVTYRLDGKYDWFEATVGLDLATSPRGRARLSLIVDGKEHALADGKERTAQDAPLVVGLDIRGAKELTLVVEFGSLGDVQARVNWGGARLIRKS